MVARAVMVRPSYDRMDDRKRDILARHGPMSQTIDLTAPAKHTTKIRAKTTGERRKRRLAALKRYSQTPRGKFNQQKKNAKVRGVPWEISFKDWCALWVKSGCWDKRGRNGDGFVMARSNDKGPYKIGNVSIIPHKKNVADRNRWWHKEKRELLEDEKPEDWHAREGEGETRECEDPFDDTPF